MKELNFEHHNNGYSLIKGFGMIAHNDYLVGDNHCEPMMTILEQEQSPDSISRRMTRIHELQIGDYNLGQ